MSRATRWITTGTWGKTCAPLQTRLPSGTGIRLNCTAPAVRCERGLRTLPESNYRVFTGYREYPMQAMIRREFIMATSPCLPTSRFQQRTMIPRVDEPGRPANEHCMQCGGIDTVAVSTFRWRGTSHLSWRCKRCRRMWVTPERRRIRRQPED